MSSLPHFKGYIFRSLDFDDLSLSDDIAIVYEVDFEHDSITIGGVILDLSSLRSALCLINQVETEYESALMARQKSRKPT